MKLKIQALIETVKFAAILMWKARFNVETFVRLIKIERIKVKTQNYQTIMEIKKKLERLQEP